MAGFDASMDKKLKEWTSEETGLIISINQYGDSDPKVQIGPRLITKKDGSTGFMKTGRFTAEDIEWLYSVIDEVRDELSIAISGNC